MDKLKELPVWIIVFILAMNNDMTCSAHIKSENNGMKIYGSIEKGNASISCSREIVSDRCGLSILNLEVDFQLSSNGIASTSDSTKCTKNLSKY